jgi:hypothetical protein
VGISMKRHLLSSVVLLALWILIVQHCQGESLCVVEQHMLGTYLGVKYALRAGGDTIMFLSSAGLYVQGNMSQERRKLIDCAPAEEQVPFTAGALDTLSRLISPSGMWQVSVAGESQIVIFDQFYGRLLRLTRANDGRMFLTKCDQRKGDDLFAESNVQDGTILSVLWGNNTKKKVVIQRINGREYRKVFRCSDKLVRLRDSVGLYNMTFGAPAINPQDSSLWLAIEGYPYVYIIDMDGELRDSVPISNGDYRRPQPEKSRMKSDAVVDEWFSHWTPITSFLYVSPGHFIMQYRTGVEACQGERLNRYSTVAWNTKKQIIPLRVDPLWRLAGVDSDGRVIFVTPTSDSSGCKETLVVTRIEP